MAAKKGDVTYEIRADDSHLESDLNEAESKVEKSTKEIEKTAEKSEKNVEKAAKESVSKTTRTHEQGNKDIENSHKESGNRREQTERKIGEAMSEIAEAACGEIGISFDKIAAFAKSPVAAGAAGAAAIAGVGVAAVNTAVDIDSAMNQLQASTGLTTEKMENYRQVMEGVYKNNYGDSFGEIADVISKIRQQVGGVVDAWDPNALQEMVESAFALRDMSLGALDVEDSIRSANMMMEQFGIDGTKALSMIAAGYQRGLNYSGELLDVISEYSVHFQRIGMDADDMFNILQKGADSGAFTIDAVGDAIKEMSIKVVDGSDTTAQGFELIGLNADEMAAKFAAGGDSAKEAFNQTISALAKMEDPLAQNTAGVDLFGTKWEDLGSEAVTALAEIEYGAYDAADAMEGIKDVKNDDLGSQFEALKRNVEMLLVPLGEELIPILSQIMEEVLPPLLEVLEPLIGLIGDLLEPLLTIVSAVLEPVLEILNELLDPFIELLESCITPLMELVEELLDPLLELIDTCIRPLLDLVLQLIEPLLQVISECIEPLIEVFTQLFDPIFQLIESALKPLLELLQPLVEFISTVLTPILWVLLETFQVVFETVASVVLDKVNVVQGILDNLIGFVQNVFSGNWRGAWENIQNIFTGIIDLFPGFIQDIIGNITDILGSLIDFIKNVFAGNWRGAWQNILDILHGIWDGIVSVFKAPLNAIVDAWNRLVGSIGTIEVPDWVPVIGGGSFSLPTLPRLKVGMDYVPSDFYPAYLDEGEAVLTKEENRLYRELGGIQGMLSLSSYLRSAGQRVEMLDIDYNRLAQTMAQEVARVLDGSSVDIDGQRAGELLTPYVSHNEYMSTRRRR